MYFPSCPQLTPCCKSYQLTITQVQNKCWTLHNVTHSRLCTFNKEIESSKLPSMVLYVLHLVNIILKQTLRWPRVSQKHNVKKFIRETLSKYVSSTTLVEKHFLWQTKNKGSHGLMAMIFLFVSTSRLTEKSIQSPTQWVPDVLALKAKQPGCYFSRPPSVPG